MRFLLRFFLSIKTTFSLMIIFIVVAVIGSVIHPRNLAFFSGIDETPLFKWLKEAGRIDLTWWIYGLIVVLAILAINTIVCTIEAIVKRLSKKNLLIKLSPQIMHIGVLFIMLGHLLTASIGMKDDILIKTESPPQVIQGLMVSLSDVQVVTNEEGYDIDWTAVIKIKDSAGGNRSLTLKPARPVYAGQIGFFVQSVTKDENETSALIRVSKDTGALWALVGGILLSAGGIIFVYAKFS